MLVIGHEDYDKHEDGDHDVLQVAQPSHARNRLKASLHHDKYFHLMLIQLLLQLWSKYSVCYHVSFFDRSCSHSLQLNRYILAPKGFSIEESAREVEAK